MSDSEEDDDDVGDPDFQLRNSTLTSESESDEEDDLFEVVPPKKRQNISNVTTSSWNRRWCKYIIERSKRY